MPEKTLKTRIIHKHDAELNWNKATNFIPKQGEIIIYDIDSNHSYERIKVGDGATNVNNLPFLTQPITIDAVLSDLSENPVQNKIIKQSFDNLSALAKTGSWNDLKDKPFYKEIKEEVLYDNPSLTFTNGYSENLGVSFEGGKTYTIIFDNISYSAVASDGISLGDIFVPPTVTIDNVISINNANCHLLDNSSGTHSLKIIGNATTIKTLDSEFLPDNIDWGKITNAPFIKAGSGTNSIIENDSLNAATGIQSHAEGYQTHAGGDYSHAEGEYSGASGLGSHAEGSSSATELYSHAEGNSTASGEYSHSEGQYTFAYGDSSHCEGLGTYADGKAQHVQGKNNVRDTENVYAHIVGGGKSSANRSNIHTLDWNGNGWFKGNVKIGGTGYDDTSSKTLATTDDINQKVDKEAGKGLSTNDFTTAEKNKLAGIAKNANNYTLPVASSTLGGVKTTSTVTSTTGLTASPIINGVIYYKDTTYTLSGLGGVPTSRMINGHALTADIELTATDVGAVSPEDLQAEGYITGISGSDVIDALGYTPVNQATLGDFTGASATQAGDAGLVPAPSIGDQEKFLRGDGTWATVSTSRGNITYPISIAQGGTGGTKLEEAQKAILDETYPAEGTDLSKFAPGIYCLPNDSNTIANVPAVSSSPLAFVFGHQNNDTAADGSPTGAYFQGYLDWEGELWLRRRKWDDWGDWMKYYSTKNIIYSSTQPSNVSAGTIWLKPV